VRNCREAASAAKRKRPGRQPSLRTAENFERLRYDFVRNPRRSASRNVTALRMSDCTVRRMLHEDLNFRPYKTVIVQTINDQETVNRKTVGEVLLNTQDIDDLNHVLMTYEANLYFCGNVSSQKCRYWAIENLRDIHQKPLYSENVIVCCSVAPFGVIGPLFL
jgi:hypothetical protein